MNHYKDEKKESLLGSDHKDESEEKKLFESSTHGFMLYNQNRQMWILSLFVMTIQFILYIIIINQGAQDLKDDQVNVQVSFTDCDDANGKLTNAITGSSSSARRLQDTSTTSGTWTSTSSGSGSSSSSTGVPQLVCEADYNAFGPLYLAMILAAVFLQYDYIASFKVLFSSGKKFNALAKFGAVLILSEAIMATCACSLFAFNGWNDSSVYDALMNCVGILFIHDIDEKVFESVEIMDCKSANCCGGCCKKFAKTWGTFLFIAIVCVAGATPWLSYSGAFEQADFY